MSTENTPLDPYKSPAYGGSRRGSSRVRMARFAMYGAYFSMAISFAGIYTQARLAGDHFFGLVESNQAAWFYGGIAGWVWAIFNQVGVVCSVYSLCFGSLKTRLACIIPAVILSRFFIQIAGSLFTKMLDWL